MGVGLIQWTGGSNKFIWEWSNKMVMTCGHWTQLIALLTPESGPYADRLKGFLKPKDNSSPAEAAVNFFELC